jgi:hypothetical protein
VQDVKEAHAARANNMFWLEMPVCAQQTSIHRQVLGQRVHMILWTRPLYPMCMRYTFTRTGTMAKYFLAFVGTS